MGRPRLATNFQDSSPNLPKDGDRFYTRVDYSAKNKRCKVYLTKDKKSSQMMLQGLKGVTDHTEAMRRVRILRAVAETSPEELNRKIAELTHVPMLIEVDAMSFDQAREDLASKIDCDQELTDVIIEAWRHARTWSQQIEVLKMLDYPMQMINDCMEPFYSQRMRGETTIVNPEWLRQNPGKEEEAEVALDKAMWGSSWSPNWYPKKMSDAPTCQITLVNCLRQWGILKNEGMRPLKDETILEVTSIFSKFIKVVGNKTIDKLQRSDFLNYGQHVNAEYKKASGMWHNRQFSCVQRVFRLLIRKTEWPFPEGMYKWMSQWDKVPEASDRKNRQPMPIEMFHQLVERAEFLALINPEEYAETLPVTGDATIKLQRMNNIKQAKRLQRTGMMWAAIFRLAANCGLDDVDVARISWKNLRNLESEFPYMDFPRRKTAHLKGQPIPRLTPLLPSTVKALMQFREYERNDTGVIFLNDARKQFTTPVLCKGYNRIRKGIKDAENWSLKHLRNIGPTLNKRSNTMKELRSEFLGHDENNTNKFYTGEQDEYFLADLVNLIGHHYFSGETVPISPNKVMPITPNSSPVTRPV